MRKIFIIFFFLSGVANAATPWWMQPTICKPDNTGCYRNMGAGYDTQMWDARGNCRGLKYICAGALTNGATGATLMGKLEIAARTDINSDFDTDELNGNCFGARRISSNGLTASINGSYEKIWCTGVLNNSDERVAGGEITFGAQPTCATLSNNGFIGVQNNKCYGKRFDTRDYFIECGDKLIPTQLVKLNGANAITGNVSVQYPTDVKSAKSLFDSMEKISAEKKKEHF